MITMDTLYKEIMDNFKEVHAEIAKCREDISCVDKRTAVLESGFKTHVDTKVKESEKKHKIATGIFAIIAAVATLYNTFFKN